MENSVKFKKECPGFVDKNYREMHKPIVCAHYCLDGTCTFFADSPMCDDLEVEDEKH